MSFFLSLFFSLLFPSFPMNHLHCGHDSVANPAIVEFDFNDNNTSEAHPILPTHSLFEPNGCDHLIIRWSGASDFARPIKSGKSCKSPKTPALNHKTSLLDRLSSEMHLPLVLTVLRMAVNLLYIWRLQILSATWLFPTYLFQLPSACDQEIHGTIHLPTLHPLS
jgi:hypothetical protein